MSSPLSRPVSGFGLAEVLSTVAIIAVLVALLMPAVASWRGKAYEAGCASNLRRLHMAVLAYAQDNDGKIPAGNTGTTAAPTEAWAGTALRQYAIDNYQKGKNDSIDRRDSAFTCPAARRARNVSNYPCTYGWNNYNLTSNGQIRLAAIPQPSLTSLIMDGVYSGGTTWYQEVGMGAGSARRLEKDADFVHKGRVNVLFIDGHIELRFKAGIPTDPNNIFWLYSGTNDPI